jgi:hypothetical protein
MDNARQQTSPGDMVDACYYLQILLFNTSNESENGSGPLFAKHEGSESHRGSPPVVHPDPTGEIALMSLILFRSFILNLLQPQIGRLTTPMLPKSISKIRSKGVGMGSFFTSNITDISPNKICHF